MELTHGLKLLRQLRPLLQHLLQVCPAQAVELHVAAGHDRCAALLAQQAAVLTKVLPWVQVAQVPVGRARCQWLLLRCRLRGPKRLCTCL